MENNSLYKDTLDRIERNQKRAEIERADLLKVIHGIEVETAKNSVSLEDHMRRTDANEARLKLIEDRMYRLILTNGTVVALIVAVAELLRRFA